MTAKTKKTRSKAVASTTPQSLETVQTWIKDLGIAQRKLARKETEMNDQIAEITDAFTPDVNTLKDEVKRLHKGIQSYCEAHRDELTEHGGKTTNLHTGEISWRQRPPSVTIRGKDAVLENLRSLGLAKFIRTKEEVNKEAMLNEAELAAGVAGVTIKTGIEDFVIKPFEQQVDGG